MHYKDLLDDVIEFTTDSAFHAKLDEIYVLPVVQAVTGKNTVEYDSDEYYKIGDILSENGHFIADIDDAFWDGVEYVYDKHDPKEIMDSILDYFGNKFLDFISDVADFDTIEEFVAYEEETDYNDLFNLFAAVLDDFDMSDAYIKEAALGSLLNQYVE